MTGSKELETALDALLHDDEMYMVKGKDVKNFTKKVQQIAQPQPHKARLIYWTLRAIGDSYVGHFRCKHNALESIEQTYPDRIESQEFRIHWNTAQTYAQIQLGDGYAYELVQTVEPILNERTIILPIHKELKGK